MTNPIQDELTAAQAAYHAAPIRRQRAVQRALEAGWSQYRIAKLWGVHHNVVAAIVATIRKNRGPSSG